MRRRFVWLALLLAACGDGGDAHDAGRPDLRVATLNVLHGTTGQCPSLDHCRLEARADLLAQWIRASGCPDVVTLQEGWSGWATALRARAAALCEFPYEVVVAGDALGVDDEIVLTRYPVRHLARQALFGGFRRVMHLRVDHPLGPVDVYTTHLAAGVDGGTLSCDLVTRPCPAECRDAGAQTRRDCQAWQLARYVEATHDVDTPAVIAGDLNAPPGSFVYRQFTERGWTDVYLAAGNPECDPATGIGCSAGRDGESLAALESPARNLRSRIDFLFLVPPAAGFPCRVALDTPEDADGDGTATRHFADAPNPFAPACGAAPLPPCWPSDHGGVEMDLNC